MKNLRLQPRLVGFFLLLLTVSPWDAKAGPQTFTLDGQLFQTGSTSPLLDPDVTLVIQILDPTGRCILYEETQTDIDTQGSKGYFNIQVGSATGAAKRSAKDSGHSMATVFQNLQPISGLDADGETCPSGSYSPSTNASRLFRIFVTPSATMVSDRLVPDMVLDSVPNALVAETISGVPLTDLVTKSSDASMSLPPYSGQPGNPANGSIWYDSGSGQIKFFNGSVQTLGTAGAGLSSLSVTNDLTADGTPGGSLNAPGSIGLSNTGVTAGDYVKVRVDAKGRVTAAPAMTDADLPTISTAGKVSGDAITSGTIGGSASVDTTGTLKASQVSATTMATNSLQLFRTDNARKVTVTVPSTLAADYGLQLPGSAGTAGQVLSVQTPGILEWTTPLTSSPQLPRTVFAGPTSGGAAAPSFRKLNITDLFSGVGGGAFLTGTSCNAGEALIYQAGTDTISCSPITTSGAFLNGGNSFGAAASLGTNDNYSLSLETNNQARMTIDNAGNIGIGRTNPGSLLDVYGNGSHTISRILSGNAANYAAFRLGRTSSEFTLSTVHATNQWVEGSVAGDSILRTEGGKMLFDTNSGTGTPALTILGANGKVGIGTTNPVRLLSLSGAANETGLQIDTTNAGSDANTVGMTWNWSDASTARGYIVGTGAHPSRPGLEDSFRFQVYDGSAWSYPLAFKKTGSIVLGQNTAASVATMTVQGSGGNVGIGTPNPDSKLTMAESGDLRNTLHMISNRAGTGTFANVIKFSSPAATGANNHNFQITQVTETYGGPGTASGLVFQGYSDDYSTGRPIMKLMHGGSGNGGVAIGGYGFHNSPAPPADGMIIPGNVGIGTTNPTAKLEVAGTIKATSFEGPLTASTSSSGAGSATAPSISFTGDPNTGFYNTSSNDTISVTTGGAKIFDFSSLGLVSATTGGASVSTADGTAAAPTFSFKGDEDTGWFRPAENMLAASTGGSERIRINNTGNVGIGTSSPQTALHIYSANPAGMTVERNSTLNSAIEFKNSNGSMYAGLATAGMFGVGSGANLNAAHFVVKSDGNVGIGTTTPLATMDVNGSSHVRGRFTVNHPATYLIDNETPQSHIHGVTSESESGLALTNWMNHTANEAHLFLNKSLGGSYGTHGALTTGTDLGAIYFSGSDGAAFKSGATIFAEADLNWTPTSLPTSLHFSTVPNGSASLVRRMTIKENGNIGVGTTNPTVGKVEIHSDNTLMSDLHLDGDGSISANGSLFLLLDSDANGSGSAFSVRTESHIAGSATELFRVGENGNVGIGTANPLSLLQVGSGLNLSSATTKPGGASKKQLIVSDNTSSGSVAVVLQQSDGSRNPKVEMFVKDDVPGAGAWGLWHSWSSSGAQPFVLGIGTAELMRVTGSGDVGIGTASPTYKLHVNGSVAGTGAYNALSDRRFKKDIYPLHESLQKILAMKGVSFHWKQEEFPDQNFSSGPDIGFIAQEVEEVFPEAVTTDSNGTKSVAYSKIVAPLVEATKELHGLCEMGREQSRFLAKRVLKSEQEIAALKAENQRKEREIASLKAEVESQKVESDARIKALEEKFERLQKDLGKE